MKKLRLIALATLVIGLAASSCAAEAFDFEVLRFRAKNLAAKAYEPKPARVPAWLQKFGYDEYRDIRFEPMRATWREENLPFQLQYFHPGGIFNQKVFVHELANKEASRVEFSSRLFNYGKNKPGRVPSDLGFAGFRIHHQLNSADYMDELVSFLGASYFRALGKGQHYGLSARGLAVNTGEPGDEEFPVFHEFWVEKPAPEAKTLTLYALLDSPSAAGAYEFVITPGDTTVMQVKSAIYCRNNPAVLGIAPLTSMFAHGENTGWARDDYRPEVHDSDGLLMENGAGEWIWRPLDNPKKLRISSFMDKSPKGFGLMQRDRLFGHYEDLEAYYHQRPSLWVEPVGDWGEGVVRLVEIPTADEFSDNIVAMWVPAKLPAPGEPIEVEYKLHWMSDPGKRPPAGFVSSTRSASVFGQQNKDLRRFIIEFEGPYLNAQPDDPDIEAVVHVGAGGKQEGQVVVHKNKFTGAWRVVFEVRPGTVPSAVELRCFLRKGDHVLSETWSYLWNP